MTALDEIPYARLSPTLIVFIIINCLFGLLTNSYSVDAVTSSGILKAKQKLGRTFNSDKLGGIAFTKISKLTKCSA